MRHAASLLLLAAAAPAWTQAPYKPGPRELAEAYRRADEFPRRAENAVFNANLTFGWAGAGWLWYRAERAGGKREYWLVEGASGAKKPAFDAGRLARALTAQGHTANAETLELSGIGFEDDRAAMRFTYAGSAYRWLLSEGTLTKVAAEPARETAPPRRRSESPDGKWTATVDNGKIVVKQAATGTVAAEFSAAGPYDQFQWSPDSRRLAGLKLIPGDRKEVFLIESSPRNGGRANLRRRLYDQPGDKLDVYEVAILDPAAKSEVKLALPELTAGGQPWTSPPDLHWRPDGTELYVEAPERGHQRFRLIAVDPATGAMRDVIDERAATFLDSTSQMLRFLHGSRQAIWRSERSGWGHLYLVDLATGATKPITQGPWVVRNVESVNEAGRTVTFGASGVHPLQDPYLIHYYRVSLDGGPVVALTPGNGTHRIQFSPDRKYFVDSYSRVDAAPVHELRRSEDGSLAATLERADISQLLRNGVRLPEVFVAKGRDGQTDIWGIVCRPSKFDPNKKYPVIENLYAGPHDSFVPKAFSATLRMQRLAELGFIVVQIDGMGTRNRSKAFHDVCWKNLADAGFPDRKLWIRALARKYRYVDVGRVGVYGTSAGGQESTAALLFHPEFYKVAVSSCGCHDNRMDKFWWNEQWMGYPVGPHYAEQSNITNAKNLQGKLLLMVGELDTNVPPESTLRLVDALIRAGKEFDFLILPGMDHTDGGPYGERKRRDFFVRHLHGVVPPDWNAPSGG